MKQLTKVDFGSALGVVRHQATEEAEKSFVPLSLVKEALEKALKDLESGSVGKAATNSARAFAYLSVLGGKKRTW